MDKEELIIYAIRTSEAIKEEKKQELIDYVSNLQQENQELKEENKQLKDNWNKLKETRIKILEAEIEQLYEFIAKI